MGYRCLAAYLTGNDDFKKLVPNSLCLVHLCSLVLLQNVMGIQEKHYNLREEVSCGGKITEVGDIF
jgi:hypothetical protein